MGEGGGAGGSQIPFSFYPWSLSFSLSARSRAPPQPPAEPQPSREQRYTGSTPTSCRLLWSSTQRERKREEKCVRMWKRERERHLMTGKVFREGFATQRHNREKWSAKVSKTQIRRISTGLDFLCSKLAGGQTSANDGSYSQTPNNQPVTIKSRHTGHDRLWRSLDTDRTRGKTACLITARANGFQLRAC